MACVALLAFLLLCGLVLFSLLLLGGALRPRRAWRVRIKLTAKGGWRVPGATPPSEVLSEPATRSEWLVHEHAVCKIEVSHLCCVCTCRRQLRACCISRACVSV